MSSDHLDYIPPKSVEGFLASDSFVSLIVGPIGSTKTTAGIMKIAYHAAQMAPCSDGVRRSKAVWVRNTREQLRDTSIPDFQRWFPDGVAGDFLKTEYRFMLRFADVECEVLFRGLDDTNDVRRLLSLQASFGILDEFREINPAIFHAIQGRLGRYPSKLDNRVGCKTDDGRENKHLWGMSNPPDMDTFWEEYLSSPPKNAEVFMQPSGLSPEADWCEFLPDDYYANLCEGKSQDWIDVYVHGKFGRNLSGQPIYRGFNADFHVAKEPIKPVLQANSPLIVGVDFGLTPAAVIGQVIPDGRLLVYDEITSQGMGAVRFIAEKLKPLLATKFLGARVAIIGDPAGAQRAQSDERSVFDMFRAAGFTIRPARTNAITARIGAVESYLARQIDGRAAMLIDPSCRTLVQGFRGKYMYRVKTNGEVEDKPEKNSYSHVHDACQYLCLHADGGQTFGYSLQTPRREVVVVNAAGWT